MKRPILFAAPILTAASLLTLQLPATAADLTPEQVAALQEKLAAMQDTLEGKASERNRSAWSVFMSASQSDKEAAQLYENCVRIVDFEREGRADSEFRDWQDGQKDRYKSEQYMESLRLQLRWLAITCKAAEAEKFETVLPDVLTYLDSLTQLSELPGNTALSSVGGSIFVRAYQLERVIQRTENWELVPFNIVGIYEKIILPYMRDEKTDQLMVAWDKRISQQTSLVEFIQAKQAAEVRGGRDEKQRIMNQQRREQNSRDVLKSHDEDDFARDTLPQLQWSRMVDKFRFVDKVAASQEMLVFLNEHLAHRKVMDWLNQFQQLVGETQSPGFNTGPPDTSTTSAPPAAPPPATTVATPATGSSTPRPPDGKPTAETLGLD